MDFAKNILKKYGWKEGDGLGRNTDGIEKPLKASFKFDNSGFGLDKAADFNNHWWERVYNDAASNIDVKNGDNVSVAAKNSEDLEISTKEYSVNKLKRLTGGSSYNNFLKSSTLSASGEKENSDRIDIDDIAVPRFQALTDAELFAACGGRTAHKGARHGLKLSGKLTRIEDQERNLLSRMEQEKTTAKQDNDDQSWEVVSKKKKKKRKRQHEEQPENLENPDELGDLLDTTEYSVKSKKKRKEQQKLDNEISSCFEFFLSSDDKKIQKGKKRKAKKKKRRKLESGNEEEAPRTTGPDELDDQLTVNSLEVNISDDNEQNTKQTKSKKTKKRERREMKKLTNTLKSSVVITD